MKGPPVGGERTGPFVPGPGALTAGRCTVPRAPLRALALAGLIGPQVAVVAVQGPAPLLLRELPLVLLALHPFAPWSLLVATRTGFLEFMAVVVLVRAAPCCGDYLLGRWYGPRLLDRLGRLRRAGPVALRVQSLSARFGSLLLLLYPGATASVLAGANGMSVRRFLPLMVAGITGAALLARAMAAAAGDSLTAVAEQVERSAVTLGAALFVATLVWAVLTRERQRRRPFSRPEDGDPGAG